jgi:hypothetical protein
MCGIVAAVCRTGKAVKFYEGVDIAAELRGRPVGGSHILPQICRQTECGAVDILYPAEQADAVAVELLQADRMPAVPAGVLRLAAEYLARIIELARRSISPI